MVHHDSPLIDVAAWARRADPAAGWGCRERAFREDTDYAGRPHVPMRLFTSLLRFLAKAGYTKGNSKKQRSKKQRKAEGRSTGGLGVYPRRKEKETEYRGRGAFRGKTPPPKPPRR